MGNSQINPGTNIADQHVSRPKRGHGEGNIYHRSDGVWVGRIMLGRKPNGRPDRPKVTGKTRGEVQRQLAELRRKADLGLSTDLAQGHQTVAAYLAAWLIVAGSSTRPQTLHGYSQIMRDHITPSLGRQKLGALRPDAIQRLYAAKLSEGLSPHTVRKIHIVLHRPLRWRCVGVTYRAIPLTTSTCHHQPSATSRLLSLPN